MSYDDVKLEDIGAGSDDGVNAKDEIEDLLRQVSARCMHDIYGDKGAVTVTFNVARQGDGVLIDPRITVKFPKRLHKALTGFVVYDAKGNAKLRRYQPEQIPLIPPASRAEATRAARGPGTSVRVPGGASGGEGDPEGGGQPN